MFRDASISHLTRGCLGRERLYVVYLRHLEPETRLAIGLHS